VSDLSRRKEQTHPERITEWSEEQAHRWWRGKELPEMHHGWPNSQLREECEIIGRDEEAGLIHERRVIYRSFLFGCSCHLKKHPKDDHEWRGWSSQYHWKGHLWHRDGTPPPSLSLYLSDEDECGAIMFKRLQKEKSWQQRNE